MARTAYLVPVALLAGCSAADPEPWFELDFAVVSGLEVADGRDTRVALVWMNVTQDELEVTDAAELRSDGTATIAVTQAPSLDTWVGSAGNPAITAYGSVLVYDDRDGDARLDWTAVGDEVFRDEVIGWSPGRRFVYAAQHDASSFYENGYNLVAEIDGVLPLDAGSPLRLFADPATACMGLVPPPLALPQGVLRELYALEPPPEQPWPYYQWWPLCPDGLLPADWWSIECTDLADRYAVKTVVWPNAPAIGELCGWSARTCYLDLDSGPRPPEFPSCD
jgi:hypothetical protein